VAFPALAALGGGGGGFAPASNATSGSDTGSVTLGGIQFGNNKGTDYTPIILAVGAVALIMMMQKGRK
jgi:hypothetical protein